METGEISYLIMIGVTNRYGFAEPTNILIQEEGLEKSRDGVADKIILADRKSIDAVTQSLSNIIQQLQILQKPKFLILEGDKEKAFETLDQETLSQILQIPIKIIAVKDEFHTRLSIINRFIRTLRDMAYNAFNDTTDIHPDHMSTIVRDYNHAYHRTLTKMIGFKVRPIEMIEYPHLEDYYIRLMLSKQFDKVHDNELLPGTPVHVYNNSKTFEKRRSSTLPGMWIVIGKEGLRYTVSDKVTEKVLKVPRWFLKEAL
jgi:hypothetical protein